MFLFTISVLVRSMLHALLPYSKLCNKELREICEQIFMRANLPDMDFLHLCFTHILHEDKLHPYPHPKGTSILYCLFSLWITQWLLHEYVAKKEFSSSNLFIRNYIFELQNMQVLVQDNPQNKCTYSSHQCIQ